jgi:hypothetical protein
MMACPFSFFDSRAKKYTLARRFCLLACCVQEVGVMRGFMFGCLSLWGYAAPTRAWEPLLEPWQVRVGQWTMLG